MNDRKIIQIHVFRRDDPRYPDGLVALADDGTVWLGDVHDYKDRDPDWREIKGLPQEDDF